MAISEKNEGFGFLPDPTLIDIGNGRLKCIETGHELPTKELESYVRSKRCRSGLIDAALLHNKPPLNAFKLDPLSRSKLICKLTGDTINKTEDHIQKHINGRRFLSKLEQTDSGVGNERIYSGPRMVVGVGLKNKPGEDKMKEITKLVSEIRDIAKDNSDMEEDEGLRLPPGECGSGAGSDSEDEAFQDSFSESCALISKELSKRTKRMTLEIGPSSFATRKKKNKPDPGLSGWICSTSSRRISLRKKHLNEVT